MNIELRYFSGTGNSYRVLDTCKELFILNGGKATLASITHESDLNQQADLIGFCFPVYAFGIPRICRKYLMGLPKFKSLIKAFVLITAGDADESGFSIKESTRILKQKGLNVIYTEVVQMPINWTVTMNPPASEEAELIISNGVNQANKIAQNILDGVNSHHSFNYPPAYTKFGFYKDYYLFKWLGLSNLWRDYRTDETCDSCGLCEEICPTKSIRIIEHKSTWLKTCEQCMRCVNYCPKQAIYQKAEGSIKGKNTYHEPGFKPLIIEQ